LPAEDGAGVPAVLGMVGTGGACVPAPWHSSEAWQGICAGENGKPPF
jgi:hypothetical protein